MNNLLNPSFGGTASESVEKSTVKSLLFNKQVY